MHNTKFMTLFSMIFGFCFIANAYPDQIVNTDEILGSTQIINPAPTSNASQVVIPERAVQGENSTQVSVPVTAATQITNQAPKIIAAQTENALQNTNSAQTETPIQNPNSTQVSMSVQNSNPIQSVLPIQGINPKQLAITVDDLPGIGDLPAGISRIDVENQMLAAFKKHNLQNVYGMVVVGQVEGRRLGRKIINHWIAANNSVANHSYSHSDLAKVSSAFYITDIQNADDYLATIKQNGSYKYFRYPYLSEGNTLAKRSAVRSYLFNNDYQIAPVTVNFSDYEWNDPYARCLKQNNTLAIAWLKKTYINQALQALDNAHYSSNILFHHDIKNILLIHLGPFDAVMMDDLLTAYEKQGMQFISLPDALSDPVYQLNRNPNRVPTYTLSKRTESRDEMNDTPLTREQMSQELEHICRKTNTNQTPL